MNVFNRLVVILLICLIVLLAAVAVVAPRQAFDYTSGLFAWLSSNVQALNQQSWPVFATVRVLAGAMIGLVALLLLWLELRRPRLKIIRAQKLAGGESFITVDSISQRLAYTIDQLPDVIRVAPRILGNGRSGLDLEILLETSPEIDVPMKTEEVLQVTKEVITERMGLKLNKVQVKIKHAPYPKQ
jgi:hypothetical protein